MRQDWSCLWLWLDPVPNLQTRWTLLVVKGDLNIKLNSFSIKVLIKLIQIILNLNFDFPLQSFTILVLQVVLVRYEVYPIRWMVLLSVTLLNLSNNALWISYASVAPVSADYFDKDINTDIDLLSTISFYVGIPMCIISTYVVDTLGFKAG